VKYAWVEEHRDTYSTRMMCQVLQVSRSGFYRWRSAEPSLRAQRSERIRQDVQRVHESSDGIYGSYKIAETLQRDDDLESACRTTVAKAMQDLGLKSKVSKRFKPKTTVVDPQRQAADNVLAQDFQADAPNRKWVTDITYLWTDSGWIYVAAVMDLFSRRIVGWSVSDSLATPLVCAALRQAIESRRPDCKELLHHSDRGSQYTSEVYQKTLQMLGITCSMSNTGCCYDNAVMERFFWSLKHEWTNHRSYANLEEARTSIFRYIETFYNTIRIHQTLDYLSPQQFEAQHELAL
jgi:putative transposase